LLCNFLHSPVNSSLFGPNILLSTLFSKHVSRTNEIFTVIYEGSECWEIKISPVFSQITFRWTFLKLSAF
jgi:hypothetical protein